MQSPICRLALSHSCRPGSSNTSTPPTVIGSRTPAPQSTVGATPSSSAHIAAYSRAPDGIGPQVVPGMHSSAGAWGARSPVVLAPKRARVHSAVSARLRARCSRSPAMISLARAVPRTGRRSSPAPVVPTIQTSGRECPRDPSRSRPNVTASELRRHADRSNRRGPNGRRHRCPAGFVDLRVGAGGIPADRTAHRPAAGTPQATGCRGGTAGPRPTRLDSRPPARGRATLRHRSRFSTPIETFRSQ